MEREERNQLTRLLKKNTKEINKSVSTSLAFLFIIIVILILLTDVLNIFHFSASLKRIIWIFGTICTISPFILFKLKVPDNVLKYYILISIQVLITALGTNNGIGIYITFMLAPLVSVAYFEKPLLRITTLFSYICMIIAVYLNAAGKLEVRFLNWSHYTTFRNYIIGFTLEYVACYVFLENILSKIQNLTNNQQLLVTELEGEYERYQLLTQDTEDIIFEFEYDNDIYKATDSLNRQPGAEKTPLEIADFMNFLKNSASTEPFSQVLLECISNRTELTGVVAPFGGKYYSLDGNVVRDTNERPVSYIGIIKDKTSEIREEQARELKKNTDRPTGMFLYPYMKSYIEKLPEKFHEGMMITVSVLNMDKIVNSYGYTYGDHILDQLCRILLSFAEKKEYVCRYNATRFMLFQPSEDYVDGFQIQQKILAQLNEIYIGEKAPQKIKCDVSYSQVSLETMDELTVTNHIDYEEKQGETRKTIYDLLKLGDKEFTEEESDYMTKAQQFTNRIMELIRSSKEPESTISAVLYQIGMFFEIDRIVNIHTDMETGEQTLYNQWCSKPEYELTDYFESIDTSLIDGIAQVYDTYGYLQYFKDGKDSSNSIMFGPELSKEVVWDVILGAQLWIPSMSEGHYTGTWQFDRASGRAYTDLEIFWLSELVNTMITFIHRMRADSANQAKSNFLSAMSHEIRTPMNVIIGMSEISLREKMSDELRYNIQTIHSAGVGLLGIINDILDFSKIESGKMEIVEEPYEIMSILNDVSLILNTRNQEKALDLEINIDENLPHVMNGDMVRIKQIMVNLGNNAIKYTDKGYVKFEITADEVENNRTTIRFSVEDSGIGIRPEDRDKLFKSFSQVDTLANHSKEGTGLGLAICKKLVDLMGGEISFESTYGIGSVFSVSIPQEVIDATPSGKLENYKLNGAKEEYDNFTAPDATILVVDDSDLNIKVFEGLLEPFKLKIDSAMNGKVATTLVQKKNYDIVFMDHMMPVMDGIEATRFIRGNIKDGVTIPIIGLSANATKEARSLFAEAGMNGFVSKPIKLKELVNILLEYIPKEKIVMGKPAIEADASTEPSTETGDNSGLVEDTLLVRFDENGNELPGINYDDGIAFCGNEELLNSLFADFYMLIDTKTSKLTKCLEDNMLRDFTVEVHALKNTSRMIGAAELSEKFLRLEKLGNDGNKPAIERELPEVLSMFGKYKKVLINYALREEKQKEKVPYETIIETLEALIESVDNFDMDLADESMSKIKGYEFPDNLVEKLSLLEAYVADVDMENIIQMSKELIEGLK